MIRLRKEKFSERQIASVIGVSPATAHKYTKDVEIPEGPQPPKDTSEDSLPTYALQKQQAERETKQEPTETVATQPQQTSMAQKPVQSDIVQNGEPSIEDQAAADKAAENNGSDDDDLPIKFYGKPTRNWMAYELKPKYVIWLSGEMSRDNYLDMGAWMQDQLAPKLRLARVMMAAIPHKPGDWNGLVDEFFKYLELSKTYLKAMRSIEQANREQIKQEALADMRKEMEAS